MEYLHLSWAKKSQWCRLCIATILKIDTNYFEIPSSFSTLDGAVCVCVCVCADIPQRT